MPTLREPSSLSDLCIDVIMKRCEEIRKSYDKRGVSLTEECQYLAPYVREQIINKALETKLDSKHLTHFLGRSIRILEASNLTQWDIKLSGFFEACKGIEEINLEGCNLSSKDLCVLFRNLKVVKRIDLARTNCYDDVLETICENCCLVTDINLNLTWITHRGLRYIFPECVTETPPCPFLQTVNICIRSSESQLSTYLFEVLLSIPKHPNNCPVNNLELQRFERSHKLRMENDEAMSMLSPILDIDHEHLQLKLSSLLKLAKDWNVSVNLTSLTVSSDPFQFQTFSKFLEDAGSHLTKLELYWINFLDLSLISKCYPNLQSFCMLACNCLPFSPIESEGCFKKLRMLEINCCSWDTWLESILMCSSNLETLALNNLEEFGDEVIEWIVRTVPMCKLNTLSLQRSKITTVGLWKLVKSNIPLSVINLQELDEEFSKERNEILEYIKMNNLNVELRHLPILVLEL